MLNYLNYDRLKKITETVKPYRGSTNRFPIGSRTQNTKFFLVDNENGDEVYKIVYGYRHHHETITEAEYEAACAAGDKTVSKYDWREPTEYSRNYKKPDVLGVVRPDNTFEFTSEATYYGQGTNLLLSRWSRGYFYASSRHGGMVYRQSGLFHPIFKGMRVHIGEGYVHESSSYRVVGHRVNRKGSKEFLKRYADFYKVSEVMLKAMDWDTLTKTAVDVVKEHCGDIGLSDYWVNEVTLAGYKLKADELINDAPLDAAILYALGMRVYRGDFWRAVHRVANGQNIGWGSHEPSALFLAMKNTLNKHIFETNHECMKQVEFEQGEVYPQSDWSYDIYVEKPNGIKFKAVQYN